MPENYGCIAMFTGSCGVEFWSCRKVQVYIKFFVRFDATFAFFSFFLFSNQSKSRGEQVYLSRQLCAPVGDV